MLETISQKRKAERKMEVSELNGEMLTVSARPVLGDETQRRAAARPQRRVDEAALAERVTAHLLQRVSVDVRPIFELLDRVSGHRRHRRRLAVRVRESDA